MNHFSEPETVLVQTATLAALLRIAEQLRECDVLDCLCTRFTSAEQLAVDAFFGGGVVETLWINRGLGPFPVAAVGCREMWPGVWAAWAWGTDDWPKVALTLTKLIKRKIIPFVYAEGAHRVQCASHIQHVEAHRWLKEALGARCEGVMKNYGRDGSDFLMFAWGREDVHE